jgi:hypothetical protein
VGTAWDEALAPPVWMDAPPVWLHGDLDPRNLLATEGHLGGVIDFGTSAPVVTPDTRGSFRAGLTVDDAT